MSLVKSDAARRVVDPKEAFTEESLLSRLLELPRGVQKWSAGRMGWIVPLVITMLAGIMRFVNLDHPHALIFDETYYVKDAYTMLQAGYELQWPDDANPGFLAGNPVLAGGPEYVVHPPLGKWLIALGMLVFGWENGMGWRSGPALFGTLSVLFVTLIAQRMFRSVGLGAMAGLFIAVDGHHLVLSRTGLLDIFLMFFAVAAFYFLLMDRDYGRRKLAVKVATVAAANGGIPTKKHLLYGPWIAWRPWRLVAAAMLAGAVSVKWSALAFIAIFCLLAVWWDTQARRQAGIKHWLSAAIFRDGPLAFITMIPLIGVLYLSTWTGWILSADGYSRQWAAENPGQGLSFLPNWLNSLAEYHRSAYAFHQSLQSDHDWESGPFSWLAAGRPVLFYLETRGVGVDGCTAAETCRQAITDLPNPLLWWSGSIAMVVLFIVWLGNHDWRAGAILAGIAAGYLPWFMYPERTMFFFYTIGYEAFLILAIVYLAGRLISRHYQDPVRQSAGIIAVGLFVVAVLLISAFFWPVWTGETIPYDQYRLRIWMPSWS
ncbi:dolichyl-phosphate-mannose--protein mannosyltransferase [Neomicrococcus lactis]|uniref:Polyprenol-phosphate-mannose--protein mannosyltransferase n=1 Tax=Neomicrococcus lactis TaxID=732241 RepID=A0A7W8YB30_9MICC|nr:dolichyl-phosphate-mannose--protein O-mannosyl transferase [Neomicrococcus lactis]